MFFLLMNVMLLALPALGLWALHSLGTRRWGKAALALVLLALLWQVDAPMLGHQPCDATVAAWQAKAGYAETCKP